MWLSISLPRLLFLFQCNEEGHISRDCPKGGGGGGGGGGSRACYKVIMCPCWPASCFTFSPSIFLPHCSVTKKDIYRETVPIREAAAAAVGALLVLEEATVGADRVPPESVRSHRVPTPIPSEEAGQCLQQATNRSTPPLPTIGAFRLPIR